MSHSFPLPPPGDEKNSRTDDDGNLLIKENHKDVKNKKDKTRYRKVKKRREKKNEDGKNVKKKDRRNKHKNKEKTQEEETKKASLEKKLVPLDLKCGERLNSTKDLPVQSEDSTFLFELERRFRNGNEPRQIQIANRVSDPDSSMVSLCKLLEMDSQILVKGCPKFNDERKATSFPSENNFCLNVSGLQNGFVCNLGKDRKDVEGVIIQRDISRNQINGEDENKHKKGDDTRDKHKDGSKEKRSKSKDVKRKKEEVKEGEVKDVFVSTCSTLKKNEDYRGYKWEDRHANFF